MEPKVKLVEQRSWQERWGVDELEFRHWCALIGAGFIVASPFFALARGEAGLLAFAVGVLAIFLAILGTTSGDGSQSLMEFQMPQADTKVTNHQGEHVWLRQINEGVTECCLVSAPCDRHAKIAKSDNGSKPQ